MLTIILAVLFLVLAFEYASVLSATRGLAELPDRKILIGRLLILGDPNKRGRRKEEQLRRLRERMRQEIA